jgi:hypothetical protein
MSDHKLSKNVLCEKIFSVVHDVEDRHYLINIYGDFIVVCLITSSGVDC